MRLNDIHQNILDYIWNYSKHYLPLHQITNTRDNTSIDCLGYKISCLSKKLGI